MLTLSLLQGAGSGLGPILVQVMPIVVIGLIFYFLVIAPANKQRRKTQEMLSSLKKGDQVLTSGGIYGTIQGVDPDVVYLKIAENVKIKVARSAVSNVITGNE